MSKEYIEREELLHLYDPTGIPDAEHLSVPFLVVRQNILDAPAADVRLVPPGGIGEMSDGYHTFNGLYYQRKMLFAALVKQNRHRAWKSRRHADGEMCFGGGWFIVGIDTPEGNYTYHYEDKDWELFDCEELPVGKYWDGHTEIDVTRLLSLPEPPKEVSGDE